MILKSIILMLTSILFLTGCIHEAGKTIRPTPYQVSSLSISHTYKIPARAYYTHWWNKFNDTQLNQLIKIGLRDSPNIKVAQSRLHLAYQLVDLSAASLWPSVDLNAYEQRQRFSKYGIVPPPFNGKTFNIADIGLNFNYEFDFWGKNRESIATQVSESCAAYAELAESRLVLSTSIAAIYFQLQSNLAQLKIAKESARDRNALLEITIDRTKHGIESDIPIKSAQVKAEAAAIAVKQYEQTVALLRNQLAVLLGKNPLKTRIVMPQFQYRRRPFKIFKLSSSLPANLLANRPDILASRYRTEAFAHQINVAKALFFPNINLLGLFSYQTILFGKLFNPQSQNNYISGAIDLPLFDAGRRRANLGSRYDQYAISVNQYNQTILTALRQVADQVTRLHTVASQLAAQNAVVRAATQNEKLILLRYRHGIADYEKVLLVHGVVLQQQSLQINLQNEHLKAVVGLYKALGGYDQA